MKERTRNVRGAFECSVDLSGKRILLIDDVMTTGATLREASRVIKLHGALHIDVAVIARAYKH
jgi:predicted amidophosphoribosyltransferase